VANQKEFVREGFKGDKKFLMIILFAKWVYRLVLYNESKLNNLAVVGKAKNTGQHL
jgi:hypothetical protein